MLTSFLVPGVSASLEAELISPVEVDVCESNVFVLYVNNTGTDPANDIVANITVPANFSYDAGSAFITLPGANSSEDPSMSGNYLEWNLTEILRSERTVVINEILPRPSSDLEQLELYNAGSSTVNVSGWYLKDRADYTRAEIPDDVVSGNVEMTPGSFLLLNISGLNNDGDDVILFDDSDSQIHSVTYGNAPEDENYACVPDGSENWDWRTSTLGASNGGTRGDLNAGESVKIEFNLTAACDALTGKRLSVSATYDGGEAQDTSDSILRKRGFLKVSKEPGVIEASKWDLINWTITVENTGLGAAYNIAVNDTPSSGLQLLSIDSPGNETNWTYGKIDPGEIRTVNASFQIIGCEDLYNEVNASWGCDFETPCQEVYSKASVKFKPKDPDLDYEIGSMLVPYCGNITVAVNITNIGLGNVTNLTLKFDGMPSVYVVSNVTNGVTYDGTKNFTVGTVHPLSERNFTFDFGMAYGSCDSAGASGTITIYPHYEDDCGNDWFPPIKIHSYSMNESTIPSFSVDKSGPSSLYLGDSADYELSITYSNGSCPECCVVKDIVDTYPEGFEVIDDGNGAVDALNHTITWSDVTVGVNLPWNETVTLKASEELGPCSCYDTVTNSLSVNTSFDCCGCPIGGSDSQDIVIACINETVLRNSRKTATPSSQENCRNVTYTNYYNFSDNLGPLNWDDMNFTELGGNGQTFPGGSNSGNATFSLDGCSVERSITIGSPRNLSFLNDSCGPLNQDDILQINYTLYQPSTTSGFQDWSRLCIEGYGSGCEVDPCLYHFANVAVCSASVSVNIAGIPDVVNPCGVYNVSLQIGKSCGNATDVNLTYDDSDFRYLDGTVNISGIVNESGVVESFEPVRNGNELFWRLADELLEGGTVSFQVETGCGPDGSASAEITWVDNCKNEQSSSDVASPSLIVSGDLIIEKNPEVIFALDKIPTWKIYVTNKGSGIAINTSLNDFLDSDLSYESSRVFDVNATTGELIFRSGANVTVSPDGRYVVWELGDLLPKQKCMVELNASLEGCENLDNRADAVWGCGDPFKACKNVSDYSRVEIFPGALLIGRHDAEPVDDCGENTIFEIEVRNGAGPTLYNISVIEHLPTGLRYVSGSSSVTGATPSSTNFSNVSAPEWRFDQPEGWASGTSVTIVFNATVTEDPCEFAEGASTLSVNYTVPCGDYGSELEDQLSLEKTNPHISITKTPSDQLVENDTVVSWTIELVSDGDDKARNVTLFDVLPGNAIFQSANPLPSGTSPLHWNLSDMGVGDKVEIDISARIIDCVNSANNTATVHWGCCPTSLGNESASAQLKMPPNITLSKDHDYIDTCGGNFTITILNGGTTAYTPEVREVLPEGFVYKLNSAVISSDNSSHNSTITNYEPQYFGNGTAIWDSSNIDKVYFGETVIISFEMESCPTCCNVSVVPNSNLVYFNYSDSCGNPHSENFSQSITPKLAELNVTKTPLNQTIGEGASWTITVTNNGNGTAYNVTVRDVLGDGFVGVAVTLGDGTIKDDLPSPGYTTIEWTGLTIDVGSSWTRTVTANGVSAGSLVNNVLAFGTCENGCIYSQDEDVAYTARVNVTKDPDSVETIGEFANFTIQVEYWGEGESYNETRIVDALPDGLSYHNHTCEDTKGLLCGGDPDVVGNTITWDLGNFTGTRTITINLTTIVENIDGNRRATILLNRVGSFHEDENGTVFDGDDVANVTIVEPELLIEKFVEPSGPVTVGDRLNYSIKVTTIGDSIPAYDVEINDTVPIGFSYVSGTQGSSPNADGSYQFGQDFGWSYDRIDHGTLVWLNYSVTVDYNVVANGTLTNRANVTWTSIEGPNDYEREGNWTSLDDYNDTTSVPVTVTNETEMLKLPDELRYRTIGEIVNYTIEITLPSATVYDLWVNDTLPEGLIYNTTISITAPSDSTYPNPVPVPTGTNDGIDPYYLNWTFGTVNNSQGENIRIEFDAIVANIDLNRAGETIANNTAKLSWEDENNIAHEADDSSWEVEVIEPELLIEKFVEPSGPVTVGDRLNYSIKVTTIGDSIPAYDVEINDTVPIGFSYVSGTQGSSPNADGSYQSGQDFGWSYDIIDHGTLIWLNYSVTVDYNVVANRTLTNRANVTWTSIEGPNDHERMGNWTSLDDYNDTTSVLVTVTNETEMLKLPDELRYRTIGEIVTYTIEITLPNATVYDLWVNDTLPEGLIYNETISITAPSDSTYPNPVPVPTGTNDGIDPYYLNWTFGTVNNSQGENIRIELDAIVANIDLNRAGETIANNTAKLSWEDENNIAHEADDSSWEVEVIEPELLIEKFVEPSGPVTVGDRLNYSIKVTTIGDSIPAYDVEINDTVPIGFSYVSGTQGSSPNADGSYQSGQDFGWSYDIIDHGTLVWLNYSVTVDYNVVANRTLTNRANVTWTSIEGPNDHERMGNWTSLDDYNDTTSVPVTVTNETEMLKLPDELRYRTIGEIVTYTIEITLPNATVYNLWVNDTLPEGLIYNETISITAPSAYSFVPTGTNDGIDPYYLNWTFGTVNNSQGENIRIELDAIVANIDLNRAGETIANNTAKLSWEDENNIPHEADDSSWEVEVIEPELQIFKKVEPATTAKTGDELRYTITVNHTDSSEVNAYDVNITDVIPSGLNLTGYYNFDPAPDATPSLGPRRISLIYDKIELGGIVTITYNVTVESGEIQNLTQVNNATVTWTSTEGLNVHERSGNWTSLDDYNDSTEVAINLGPALLGDFVWIDANVNGIQDPGEIGVPDIIVKLYNDTGVFIANTTTNATGYYNFSNLLPGDYYVEFVPPGGYKFSPQNQGSDDSIDSDANVITGETDIVSLSSGDENLTTDAGLYLLGINVTKTVDISSGPICTNVNFTINVTNNGNAIFAQVVVNDTLPTGLNYVNSTPAGVNTSNFVNWTLGKLGPSNSTEIYLVAHINGERFGVLTNNVNVTGFSPVGDNVTDNDTENVNALNASIDVNKTVDISSGPICTNVTFTINVTNTGNASLTSVIVEDLLPEGLDYVSDGTSPLPDNVTLNPDNSTIIVWDDVIYLAPGDWTLITLKSHINGEKFGTLVNNVNATGVPPTGDNVTDEDSEPIEALNASIDVNKTVDISSGPICTNVTFTINVTNTGNASLTSVRVEDLLPEGLDYVSDGTLPLPDNVTLNPDNSTTIVWDDVTSLAPGDWTLITLKGHINGDKFGTLVNKVNATGVPPTGDNVTDEDSEPVEALNASIDVNKTVDISSGPVCTNVTFTINVTNTGNASLTSVRVEDLLPEGLDYVSDGTLPLPDNVTSNPDNSTTLVWDDVTSLAPGDWTLITLKGHINGDKLGTLVNKVNATGVPPTGYNVTGEDFEPVEALNASVDVNKTADIPNGSVNSVVNFTINVTNTGDAVLDPVLVTDTLPEGLDYVASAPGGSHSDGVITWNLGKFDPGNSTKIYLEGRINGGLLGVLVNGVEVKGVPATGDNVTDEDSEPVEALNASIDVNKIANNTGPLGVGDDINYTINVANTGNITLDPVIVNDTLPVGLTYVTSTPLGVNVSNNISWNLGALGVGTSKTITLIARVDGSQLGKLINEVNVSGALTYGANVTSNDTELVQIGTPAISVNKTAYPKEGAASTNVTFTLNVTNTGDVNITSVKVVDLLPAGMNYVADGTLPSPDENTTNANGTTIVWENVSSLQPNESVQVYLMAHIDGTVLGNLTNVVNVVGDPEAGDNVTDEDTENVTARNASIRVEKTADPASAELLDEVTFSINVTNTGGVVLDPVRVVDTLPEHLSYVSADPQPNETEIFDGNWTLTWNNIGLLEPNSWKLISLVGRIEENATGVLENWVEVVGTPPTGANVTDNDTATVTLTGLNVTKKAAKKELRRGEENTYTITICNPAPYPVYDVVVKDVFDRQVEFVSASPMPDPDGIWRFDMIPEESCISITLVVRIPRQDLEFGMEQGVSGEGFVNVANDYSTTLQSYVIRNRVFAVYEGAVKEYSASESVTVLGEPGTELETREHGSGLYESEEVVQLFTENKSIEMDKDMAATHAPTTLGLYRNRTITYNSTWTEKARAKNRVTGASMYESYCYATKLDRESDIKIDKAGTALAVESEFEGQGHIGFLKKSSPGASAQDAPIFESGEDYTGSFRIGEEVSEYGSSVTSDKTASGEGFVSVDKRVKDSQRSYEYGTGSYESDEQIRTSTNYIAKDISLVYSPANQSLVENVSVNQSLKWKEGMWSKNPKTHVIGEEYTSIESLDKETVAKGLNEMATEAEFSGAARYRTALKGEIDLDEEYIGYYAIQRKILFQGVPKYDRPHLSVTKELVNVTQESGGLKEKVLEGENREKIIQVASYNISIENDGNRALAPIYVKDFFPPGSLFMDASIKPSELKPTYANWTLTHLSIGDIFTISLRLNVTNYLGELPDYKGDEMVNRVLVCGGYGGNESVCVSNFSALEIDWLTCCLEETLYVTKVAQVDQNESDVVWYTIEIQNLEDSTRVADVTDTLPQGMILLDTTVPFSSYEIDTVIWNLIEIEPFETETITYKVKALRTGRFENQAVVEARSVDGSSVPPVYADAVLILSDDECQPPYDGVWRPPDWDFENVGDNADITCDSCD